MTRPSFSCPTRFFAPLLLSVCLFANLDSHAQETAGAYQQSVHNLLGLSATAMVDVANDVLSVTFSTMREGTDANAVQSDLKRNVEAALAEARKVAKPGQVDVRAGQFSLHPRYSNKGVVNGWQGSAEVTVEGRDMAAIAQLTGRIQTMTIARVAYSLSRETREKVEADVTAQAIARYRAKAGEMAKQFGYGGYSIREVHVSTGESGGGPVPLLQKRTMAAMAEDAALPVEGGKGTVTATVSGTVQMK